MLDAAFIRDNLDAVKANCLNRGVSTVPVDRAIAFDDERKRLERLRGETAARQNQLSAGFKDATPERRKELKEESGRLKDEIRTLDEQLQLVEGDLLVNLLQIPNMTHPAAPVGKDAAANKVVATFGQPRKFDFKPKDHVALCEALDLADFEAGTRVAGQKFYFLK
ncbi:MAG TPA: serine--tRNA ligase, partial [Gemmataceae bacterium]|nr:serine--tRNA ligase [Gemmataceae bacterium]